MDEDSDTKEVEILPPRGNDNPAMQPPLLSDEALMRVYRLARRDGMSVLIIASIFSLFAAMMGDMGGAMIGLTVAGAGALELQGCHLLREGEPRGVRWLITSQLALMSVILIYCLLRLLNFQPELVEQAITPQMREVFTEAGYTTEMIKKLIEKIYYLTYSLVGIITIIYQSMMARHYYLRREAITQACTEE